MNLSLWVAFKIEGSLRLFPEFVAGFVIVVLMPLRDREVGSSQGLWVVHHY